MPRPQPVTRLEPRLRAAEAANLLGVSARMVQLLCARGELPAIRVGRLWTTTESALSNYLASQVHRVTQSAPTPAIANMPQNAPERPVERATHVAASSPAPKLPTPPTRERSRFESLLQRRS
jgi:excisionase family DNA binding protein